MENLNFISSVGKLTVYCFVYGHGKRIIATYDSVCLSQVSDLVNNACASFLLKTRLSNCKKLFSYKFDC